MAKEQSLNGNTGAVLDTSQNFTGNETPLDKALSCSQQNLGLSRSQKKRKRHMENRRARAQANIVLNIHPLVVTSLENHPLVEDSESAPPEIDCNKSTEGEANSEICPAPPKRRKKKQKKGDSTLRSVDIDGRCAKDTSLDVIPVKLDSELHHMRTTRLADNSEMTVPAAEPTPALSTGRGNQHMCQGASTTNAANQDFQEVASHCVANIGFLEKLDEHSGLEVVEELDSSKKYLGACSVGEHQGGRGSNVSSLDLINIKTYQRGRSSNSILIGTGSAKADAVSSIPVLQDSLTGDTSVSECKNQVTYYRRRKNMRSGSHLSSLESLKESASPVEILMQNSSAGDTAMDHPDKAIAPGSPEKIIGEVVATHDMSLLVAEDIVMRKAFGEGPDDSVTKEEEKTIEIENFGGTVLQHSVKRDDSGNLPEKSSILDNINKVEKDSVLDKCKNVESSTLDSSNKVETSSVLESSNKVEVVENTAKHESLQEPANVDQEGNALGGPPCAHLRIGHIESGGMEMPSSLGNAIASSSQLSAADDNSSLAVSTMGSPRKALKSLTRLSRKKLLVLDVNGILADIVVCGSERTKPDIIVSGKAVFKRPFCDDFLQFCFERFNVGVWSSRTKRNVEAVINFLMRNSKNNLLFCWDQSHCTETGFNTVENREKPLVLKELKNLWEKNRQGLPWKRGEYNESNTLLLDDSPYKALRNPPYTAIFPHPYNYLDRKDNCLGPGGDLRIYLEGLAGADNVQSYVKSNPFGQRPITERNVSWRFYLKVISSSTSRGKDTNNDGSVCVSEESAATEETLLSADSAPTRDNVEANLIV